MGIVEQKGYENLAVRLALSLLAAHFMVAFGATETFFQLLLSASYYRSLAGSFVIAFSLISMVYIATRKLDKRHPWSLGVLRRILLQSLFGWLLPSIAAFLLAAVYFKVFDINILDTNYLRFDFPVVVLLLLLLNIYYFCFYMYRQWKEHLKRSLNDKRDIKQKSTFIAIRGNKNIPVSVDEIAYFYHRSDCNFLRTFDNDDYIVNQSLEDIQKQFSAKQFFRVNRQLLVNIRSCRHFEAIENQKLKLHVQPELNEDIIISQKRAKEFKEWMMQ